MCVGSTFHFYRGQRDHLARVRRGLFEDRRILWDHPASVAAVIAELLNFHGFEESGC
jgi:hypothetical protein